MGKTCTKCGETKPLSEFHKNKNAKDGHTCHCKKCRRAQNQAYYAANGERVRATVMAYRKANPDRIAARDAAYRKANPERVAAASRAWAMANPERAAATKRAWEEANFEHVTDSRLQKAYGLSLPEYVEMIETQENRCAICGGVNENGRRLCVDHDRKTGEIRGLLCGKCNRAIGLLQHDPGLLHSAITYLEQWNEKEPAK